MFPVRGGHSAGYTFQLEHQDRLLGRGDTEADLRTRVPSAGGCGALVWSGILSALAVEGWQRDRADGHARATSSRPQATGQWSRLCPARCCQKYV